MYTLLSHALFQLDPETAHNAVKALSPLFPVALLQHFTLVKHPSLATKIGATPLSHPIGLAAGFDKNAELTGLAQALGFACSEIGSITAQPCPGNPRPRLLRLPQEQSLINWLGLPNQGAENVARRISQIKPKIPLGLNIAKTPDFAFDKIKPLGVDDYLFTYEKIHHQGAYLVFNLSCPNTGETETFEDPEIFRTLAKNINGMRRNKKVSPPHLIKISPDLEPAKLKRLLEIAGENDFDGFVVGNTTRKRTHLKKEIEKKWGSRGGLSGKALTEPANAQLKKVFEIVGKEKIIIGVGGIMNFSDLLTKISHGATLVQVYTGLIYNGPFFVRDLNKKLVRLCKKIGVKNYQELVGRPMSEMISAAEA